MATPEENLREKFRNALNLVDIDWTTPVYRVFPIERLIQLLTSNQNTLVKPHMWDDPFENLVFQHNAVMLNGRQVGMRTLMERYFGQCWTLNQNESDALWRIYSSDKNGVRVKTTLQKLYDSFYNENNPTAMVSYYIGRIMYETEQDLRIFFQDPHNLTPMVFDPSGRGGVQTLLVKRTEFTHENEVRLIYCADSANPIVGGNIFQYPIDPNDLIDELLFDPRFEQTVYNQHMAEIRTLGYQGSIRRSTLYQLPNLNLTLNV